MKQWNGAVVAIATLGTALVLTSCTCKIKDEQLAQVRQLRSEEKQLAADIQKAESDRTKIQGELSSRQGEVRNCNQRLSFVQQKKAAWPNVWDWDPNAPEPVPTPAPTPKKK
jgi:outer membrane murein-binding lipoprotein Lpp